MLEPLDLPELLLEMDSDEASNFGLPIVTWTVNLLEAFVASYVRVN
jgi:hypothetical protein